MFHLVARSVQGTLLFTTWEEAGLLWRAMVRNCPGLDSLVLMPDHIHLMHPHPHAREMLHRAARAFARSRNHRRGETGPVFRSIPDPEPIADSQKIRRNRRYLALNPTRKRLCVDPLAWPFSTHRDGLGLVVEPVRPAFPRPATHHGYVSGDPSVDPSGTPLPQPSWTDTANLFEVRDAVSAVLRAPEAALRQRGPPRTLFLRSARVFTQLPTDVIAHFADVTPRAVRYVDTGIDPAIRVVALALRDPRFEPLHPGDLRLLRTWAQYRNRR